MRPLVEDMLSHATAGGAIIYYDINFRSSHSHELEALLPTIEDNCRRSSIVRGSADDFEVLFGERDAATIYDRHIRKLCPVFICTSGAGAVTVCLPHDTLRFPVPRVEDVASTVGAGDNFNAGLACSLIWRGIRKDMLPALGSEEWQHLLATACAFSGNACRTLDNYISVEFGLRASGLPV